MASLFGRREENEIRCVMVGSTGSGKSATGNTIIGKANHFESKLTGGSVTRECKRGEYNQAGRKIVLVDTPGLFDTKLPFEKISKEIIRCVNMSTPGPHAFLLVIQIGRFGDEEIETFNRIFDLFGDEMGKFAIITFTKLDDLEIEQTTIEQYIEMAPQKLKHFLKRCQGRYLALDNKACEKIKSEKVKTLIQLVDSIINKNRGNCYSNDLYKKAEAALQQKVKIVEDERAREKKKGIEQIQSKYVHKMDSITKENNKLAQQVRSNKESQLQVQKEKDQAQQDVYRMADEMKKIDKKYDQELYQIKEKEKENKEKQAKSLEEKERQQMQFVQSMEQRQIDMDKKYQNLERQKELQLAKVAEDHNKIMAAEMQRILDGNNLTYDEMMKEEKNKAYDKLQEKMAHQYTSMNEQMRERDQEFHKLEKEHRKRLEEERDRANETLKSQLEEQKQSIEATTKALLQEQREMDKTKRNDQEKANNKAYNKLQEQLAQQNATLENMMRERDLQAQKQQKEHRKQIQEEKEKRSFQDRENEIQRQEFYKLEKEHRKRLEEERDRPNETLKRQLEEQKQSIEATTKALLQEQREMDKTKRSDQDESNNKAYNKLQEQLAQQNAPMQKLIHDGEQKLLNQQHLFEKRIAEEEEIAKESARKQQEEHKRSMDANTESIIREQSEMDKRQSEERQMEMKFWEESQELKRQNEKMQEKIKQQEEACLLS